MSLASRGFLSQNFLELALTVLVMTEEEIGDLLRHGDAKVTPSCQPHDVKVPA